MLLLLLWCGLLTALADDENHVYQSGEEVTLWLNKVGPYHNPSEVYDYRSLPFCSADVPKTLRKKSNSLGVALDGSELYDSGLTIKFMENQPNTRICEMTLDAPGRTKLFKAVRMHYWFQMYIDELPVWGMLGIHQA